MNDSKALFDICEVNNWRIATAESCTGGGLGYEITRIPGASRYFWGGVIAYSNDVKINQLFVQPNHLQQYGAVSEVVAKEMAEGVRALLKVEIGLSVTGVAGPGAEGTKPEGRVCFGISSPQGTESFTCEFGAIGRDQVRIRSIQTILKEARLRIA